MCFHASQTKKVSELENHFQVEITDQLAEEAFNVPMYHLNGFTHPEMLIIPQEEPSALAPSMWGIVPKNKNEEQILDYYKEAIRYGGGLNARSEKIFDHFIYKHSAKTRRCIIPVTGFYEPHEYKSKKYPFHIKRKDNEVISLAGLYNIIGDTVTFTILTREASPLFAKIHNKKNRQPVMLLDDLEQEWLRDDFNENHINEIINAKYNESELSTYTVSKELFQPQVNSNQEDILTPVDYGIEL